MGCRIGIKSGVFGIVHCGHIWAIRQAKRYCDYLIILTNTDEYVKNKKGCVPLKVEQRMAILSALPEVDEVHCFDGPSEEPWIERFAIDTMWDKFGQDAKLIIFHSSELSKQENLPGADFADSIVFIDRNGIDCSVSKIFETILSTTTLPKTTMDISQYENNNVYRLPSFQITKSKIVYQCGCTAEGTGLYLVCPQHGKPIKE